MGLEDEVDECGREDGWRGGEERSTHGSAELELKVSSDWEAQLRNSEG